MVKGQSMQIRPPKYLVLAEGRVERPHLSARGGAVAWTQEVDGQQDVFVASAGETRRVTETPENEGFALVSDDARTIAFTRRSAESNIWQLHVRREGQQGVVEDGGHHVQSAALSADGQRLAWENHGHISQADPTTLLTEPTALGAETSSGARPRHGDHDARQLKPQLSGDGRVLLYQVSDLDSAQSHLVVEPEGRPAVEIGNNTDAPTALNFDGSVVVYPTTDEQGFHGLSMLDLSSGLSTVVGAEAGADASQPSVAANGDVVFLMTRYDQGARPVSSIVQKTARGLAELVPPDGEWDHSAPQLSADGKTMLWLASSKQDPDHRQLRQTRLG